MGYKKERIKEENVRDRKTKNYDYLKQEDKPVEVFLNMKN